MSWAALSAQLLADPNPARIEAERLSIGGRLVDAMLYNTPGILALLAMLGRAA